MSLAVIISVYLVGVAFFAFAIGWLAAKGDLETDDKVLVLAFGWSIFWPIGVVYSAGAKNSKWARK